MRILKVAHIVEPYPHAGGFGTSVGQAARWLVARGHSVTVLSGDHGPRPHFETDGAEFVYLPQVASFRRVGIAPGVFKFADDRLRDFDVVHFYGTYDLLSPVIARVARRYGVPYVIEPKGNLPPATRSIARKRIYAALLGRTVWRGARAVISNSELERARLGKIFGSTPLLIRRPTFPNAPASIDRQVVDAWRTKLTQGEDRKIVLFLGRIAAVKALDVLAQACARVQTPLTLVLAGPVDGDDSMDRTILVAERLGVRLQRIPAVNTEQKWHLLAAADVLALVSYSESFGLAAAEALAVGVPVVVSRFCGIADDVARAGAGLVVDTEPGAIANALDALLTDAALRRSTSENGFALARAASGDESLIQLERMYDWARDLKATFTVCA